jgi:hypothetical protein
MKIAAFVVVVVVALFVWLGHSRTVVLDSMTVRLNESLLFNLEGLKVTRDPSDQKGAPPAAADRQKAKEGR